MEKQKTQILTTEAKVNAPIEKVWKFWTEPTHITKWNFASDDWQSPSAENDLKPGGKFNFRMEAKDGSFGFDFGGTYDTIHINHLIEYTLGDGRKVKITFTSEGNSTHIVQSFETEHVNPPEMQQNGWQAILNNFKKHAEAN